MLVTALAAPALPRSPAKDPFALRDPLPDSPIVLEPDTFDATLLTAPLLAGSLKVASVPPPPASCAAWTRRKPSTPPACSSAEEGRSALDWALEPRANTDTSDERLASLETCKGLEPGLIRALRTDLAAAECGDELALPLLHKRPAGLRAPIFHVLLGLSIAARVVRLASSTAPGALASLDELEKLALAMPRSYGRALALAGVAAARLRAEVDPDKLATAASLAAVVAMGAEGIGESPRVEPALFRLSVQSGWLSEIDALRLPPPPDSPRGPRPKRPVVGGVPVCPHCYDDRRRALTLSERFAEELPPFFAAYLLTPDEAASPEALRPWARKYSLPTRARSALAGAKLSAEAVRLVAQARLGLGIRFLDRRNVDAAAALLAAEPVAEQSEESRLLFAVALSLHGGPVDASAWTERAPRDDSFDHSALDVVAKSANADLAALAAYDREILSGLESGPRAGDLRALDARLADLTTALRGGKHPTFLWERQRALNLLREQQRRQSGYQADAMVRLTRWPEVQPSGGGWHSSSGVIFIAIRAGNVNRTLRRLGYRFEPCFKKAATATEPPESLLLEFIIARDGTSTQAVAKSEPAGATELEACVAREAEGLLFPQPDGGSWSVRARLRAR